MSILALPNEILLLVASFLEPRARYRKPADLYHLIQSSVRFANLLLPSLTALAYHNQNTAREALYRAAAFANEPNARRLLNHGRFLEVRQHTAAGWRTIWNTRPKLRTAPQCPDSVVAFVLDQGPNLVLDWIGVEHSGLHWGVSAGDTSLVKDLLACGAIPSFAYARDWPVEIWGPAALLPPSIPFSWDSGPLHKASYVGHLNMVKLLLQNGAEVNVQDELGRTALDAAVDGGHECVVRYLLDEGADINLPNRRGQTGFLEALKTGDVAMVRLLVHKGADVHVLEHNGRSAVHLAVENEYEAMVSLLLEHGVDVAIKDANGDTALHLAAERGLVGCVGILLEAGADRAAVNGSGKTPMQAALLIKPENGTELAGFLEPDAGRWSCIC